MEGPFICYQCRNNCLTANDFELNKNGEKFRHCNKCRVYRRKRQLKSYTEKRKKQLEERELYNELHKDEIAQTKVEKEQAKKEQNTEKCRKWRANNIERVKENDKEYYEKTKEKYYKSIDCECGGKYCLIKKSRHQSSNRHQKYLESLNQ